MLMMITIGKSEIIFSRFKNVFPPVQVVLGHNHLEEDEDGGGNYTDYDDDNWDDDHDVNEAKIDEEESDAADDTNQSISHWFVPFHPVAVLQSVDLDNCGNCGAIENWQFKA